MPTPTLTNVVYGQATGYTAPVNEPMPANSVVLGGSWGGNWAFIGGTDAGITFNVAKNANDIMIEEQSTPAAISITSTDISATFALAEDTVENMKLAFGSGSLAVNSGATPPNKVLTLADALNPIAFGFEGINPFGKQRRVYIPNAVVIAQVSAAYRRAADKRMYAVTVRAICAPSSVTITEITG